jgi:hypothetical protein
MKDAFRQPNGSLAVSDNHPVRPKRRKVQANRKFFPQGETTNLPRLDRSVNAWKRERLAARFCGGEGGGVSRDRPALESYSRPRKRQGEAGGLGKKSPVAAGLTLVFCNLRFP